MLNYNYRTAQRWIYRTRRIGRASTVPTLVVVDLQDLLKIWRRELVERWVARVRPWVDPLSRVELQDQMPLFVDELIAALHPDVVPLPVEASTHAVAHGEQRLRLGFEIDAVVREYGALHECIFDLAEENDVEISLAEHRVLVAHLSRGTSDAVAQYEQRRDKELEQQAAKHLGFLAHELRNPLAVSLLSFGALRRGPLKSGGRQVDALARGLSQVSELVDRALSHNWLERNEVLRKEPVNLPELLSEVGEEQMIHAEAKRVRIVVTDTPGIVLHADRTVLRSAVSNLVRNAVKFTAADSVVTIRTTRDGARVNIEVEDGCGGLPSGRSEELFEPFVQKGDDRSGFGLGLAIAKQAVEAHGGRIAARSIRDTGCVFSISLAVSEGPEAGAR
jgi:signal transduction histidine kinase